MVEIRAYEGTGETLEEAATKAHMQIPPRVGRDFAVSRVLEWGLHIGGFTGARTFYVRLIEDVDASFEPGS